MRALAAAAISASIVDPRVRRVVATVLLQRRLNCFLPREIEGVSVRTVDIQGSETGGS